MNRLLITGASGFVGRHLVEELQSNSRYELHGCSRSAQPDRATIRFHPVDWNVLASISSILREVQPAAIVHLAGHADAGGSYANPLAAWTGNLTPTIHLYEAIHQWGGKPRVLHVSSGAVYGRSLGSDQPVDESAELLPVSPYAASKAAGEMAAIQHDSAFPIVRVRPFNHIGPGQSNHFALANFAEQIARIEMGLAPPILETGNLDVERDIIDVRDMVQAYMLLLEKGSPGQVYNAGRGQPATMQHCVDLLLRQARVPITHQIRAARQRPIDVRRMRISVEKLHSTTGWSATIPLEKSLDAVLNDWRQRITNSTS